MTLPGSSEGHFATNPASKALLDHFVLWNERMDAALMSRAEVDLRDSGIRCMAGMVDFADDAALHADQRERHPDGDELILVVEGRLLVLVEYDVGLSQAIVEAGLVFIVPRGCWHRLSMVQPGRMVFLTPSPGTEQRTVSSRGKQANAACPE